MLLVEVLQCPYCGSFTEGACCGEMHGEWVSVCADCYGTGTCAPWWEPATATCLKCRGEGGPIDNKPPE
jgi:hypothetical protein